MSLTCSRGISLLLSTCGRERNVRLGSSIHAFVLKDPQFVYLGYQFNTQNALVVWNSLLTMYARCGRTYDAAQVFDEMPMKDTVSWNSIISGFVNNGNFNMGFGYFKEMMGSGCFKFDHASLTTILSACDGRGFLSLNKMIHGLVVLSGMEREISVSNALVTSYFRCGCANSGRQVFDEMDVRNVISWTAVISGLAQNEFCEESLDLFVEMQGAVVVPNYLTYLSALLACSGIKALGEARQIHGIVWKLGFHSDLCIESALMDVYSKCGSVQDAWQMFESAEVLDTIAMTVMLVGFAQNGYEEEALQIFVKMVKSGVDIDPDVVSAVLGVFGSDTSLGLGRQVHSLIIKKGFISNSFVSNGLINMYSKCGQLEESVEIFNSIARRNSVSWNSIIAAYARHGNGYRALQLYEEMRSDGVDPTDVTFISLLHACSHVGLVNKGMEFFESMQSIYGMTPRMEHYAAVVDLLGRAGLLSEAKSFIEGLTVKPDILIWQALLGACSIHGDAEMGKYAADQWVLVSPDNPVPYVLLANIYSSRGRWKDRARTIKKMKEMGVAKETGTSWIEIEKEVHSFVVADQMHPRAMIIYSTLSELFRHMRDEGYVPDNRLILYYMDSDEKEFSVDLRDTSELLCSMW
ncbi:PREDICTED: pentatricopeptide repeat-containing protein At3g05340 [Nicotiana attenuata]|uniref:Pentatricopeptide repeat-containing protein n=1 Tax=Nicotiana attenuata TaxID=49451 RepID=A0A314L2J1_NICAT|nr:PREDICTED: pentatricopeptide repeat-containing protein At3g05340 [Nicotiana attenuata]OIT35856.1 pentatricopeptide repeat-containing protein [Nicotiana attenuata]